MKHLRLPLHAALFVVAITMPARAIPDGYILSWSDEFDGTGVNPREWNYRLGKSGLSTCTTDSVFLAAGAMHVALKSNGDTLTGGGLISRRPYTNGYFEVAARVDGGPGWHEAFWTSWADSREAIWDPERVKKPRIEIDCFEHYGNFDGFKFSYGTILWHPVKGGINRDYHTYAVDLSLAFHTYGFEINPDFVAYYLDGTLLKVADVTGVGQSPFHLWLTSIATMSNARANRGVASFDYLRCYAPDPATFGAHRKAMLARIAADRGTFTPSKGTDLWIEAEDFGEKGTWSFTRNNGAGVLRGLSKADATKSEVDRSARTAIDLMSGGKYRLWVLAFDDPGGSGSGTRTFDVRIGDEMAFTSFGKHGGTGFRWEDGGVFDLPAGMTKIAIIDRSQFYARCDKLLLTTDMTYVPTGDGGPRNIEHKEGWK